MSRLVAKEAAMRPSLFVLETLTAELLTRLELSLLTYSETRFLLHCRRVMFIQREKSVLAD